MEAIDLLLNRATALKLGAPGPSEADLDAMFGSAVRTPDHGRLRPWHFVVIGTDQRERFGEVLADSMRRKMPDASEDALQRERAKAMRAPTIVVAAARTQKGHKIPEFEQVASAAAATQTLLLAANARGFGAMWKTGDAAYDPAVKTALGLRADDEIVGFLYVGTDVGGEGTIPRPEAKNYVSVWAG
jgi:nitroreductase